MRKSRKKSGDEFALVGVVRGLKKKEYPLIVGGSINSPKSIEIYQKMKN